MTTINLLPWRDELRDKRKRDFIRMSIFVALLGVLLIFLVYMFFANVLANQQTANQRVVDANTELNNKLTSLDGLQGRSEEILERMKLIQDLQSIRPVVVHVFDELAKFSPEQLYITQFSRDKDQFVIEGKAQDLNVVGDFLRQLDSSPWFRNAFMRSFVATENKEKKQGAVAPQPEESYGDFVVTVDLADISKMLADPQAQIAGSTP